MFSDCLLTDGNVLCRNGCSPAADAGGDTMSPVVGSTRALKSNIVLAAPFVISADRALAAFDIASAASTYPRLRS